MTDSPRTTETLRREIITLAFVGTALAETQDYFLALGPIFAPLASDLQGKYFESGKLRAELKSRYGIVIPEEVGAFLAARLHRLGYLERAAEAGTEALYRWVAQAPSSIDSSKFDVELDKLVEELARFRDRFASPAFNDLTADDLLATFVDHMKNLDEDVRRATRAMNGNGTATATATAAAAAAAAVRPKRTERSPTKRTTVRFLARVPIFVRVSLKN